MTLSAVNPLSFYSCRKVVDKVAYNSGQVAIVTEKKDLGRRHGAPICGWIEMVQPCQISKNQSTDIFAKEKF